MKTMNRTERFYKIDQLLSAKTVVTRQYLLDELEVSWATLKRDLAYLRERFNAPIIFDSEAGGYRFADSNIGPSYELPGLWFNADETYALLSMHRLLSDLEPGLLAPHVAPLKSRLESILGREGHDFTQISNRIRLSPIGKRRKETTYFPVVSRAILEGRRLQVTHYSREKNERNERLLSPLRLVYYRSNWYLEAWCHTKESLRRFSVDAFESVNLLTTAAKKVSQKAIEAEFGSSYGIYGGAAKHTAELRFTPAAARWVADEEWHPEQVGKLDEEGYYLLKVPYAEPTELIMDILRHGRHVQVLGPVDLKAKVAEEIQQMSKNFSLD